MCVNNINGKIYVGSSSNLRKRIPKHKYRLNLNKHENQHLQSAYNKYGKEAFEWYIIETCTEDQLIAREQYYINLYHCSNREFGYNIMPDAMRRTHTAETIEKIRAKRKLQKPTFLGRKHTEESKAKMSAALKGRKVWCEGKTFSPEHIENLRKSHLGYKLTDEAKKKLSIANKGRKMPMETRIKIKNSCKGRTPLDKNYIRQQLANGRKALELAAELDCTLETIYRCMRQTRI